MRERGRGTGKEEKGSERRKTVEEPEKGKEKKVKRREKNKTGKK